MKTPFSWAKARKQADEHNLYRAHIMAKTQNADFKIKYPQECKDAQTGKFTNLDILIKKQLNHEHQKYDDKAAKRRKEMRLARRI